MARGRAQERQGKHRAEGEASTPRSGSSFRAALCGKERCGNVVSAHPTKCETHMGKIMRDADGRQKGGGGAPPTMLAMGIVITRWVPQFRRRTPQITSVSWRYVTTERSRADDPLFAVVDCPDIFFANATTYVAGNRNKIVMGFQFSCFCKTAAWYRVALELEPTARFVGKMEDDSVLHDSRVIAELMHFQRLARREAAAARVRKPLPIWYGHFAWALFHDNGRARFCGDADDHLVETAPRVCARHVREAGARGILAPFASGGLDVRSRSLVEQLAACEQVWQFIRGFDASNVSYQASCDGQQGYFAARCLALAHDESTPRASVHAQHALTSPDAGGVAAASQFLASTSSSLPSPTLDTRVATLLHLPWPKFHKPNNVNGARLHSSILHPHRPCSARASGGRAKLTERERLCAEMMPTSWRWNLGHGLLPFQYTLHGTVAQPSGMRSLWWQPRNRSMLRLYNRLHAHREDDKYCEMLPCGIAASTGRGHDRKENATLCGSMKECFASHGEGGRYFYLRTPGQEQQT